MSFISKTALQKLAKKSGIPMVSSNSVEFLTRVYFEMVYSVLLLSKKTMRDRGSTRIEVVDVVAGLEKFQEPNRLDMSEGVKRPHVCVGDTDVECVFVSATQFGAMLGSRLLPLVDCTMRKEAKYVLHWNVEHVFKKFMNTLLYNIRADLDAHPQVTTERARRAYFVFKKYRKVKSLPSGLDSEFFQKPSIVLPSSPPSPALSHASSVGNVHSSSSDDAGSGGEAHSSSSDDAGSGGEAQSSSSDDAGSGGEAHSSSSDDAGSGAEAHSSSSDDAGSGGEAHSSSGNAISDTASSGSGDATSSSATPRSSPLRLTGSASPLRLTQSALDASLPEPERSAEERLQDCYRSLRASNSEVARMRFQVDTSRRQMDTSNRMIAQLENEAQQRLRQAEDLRDELSQLRGENRKMSALEEARKVEYQKLQSEFGKLYDANHALNSDLRRATDALREASEERKKALALESEGVQLRAELKKLQGDLEECRKSFETEKVAGLEYQKLQGEYKKMSEAEQAARAEHSLELAECRQRVESLAKQLMETESKGVSEKEAVRQKAYRELEAVHEKLSEKYLHTINELNSEVRKSRKREQDLLAAKNASANVENMTLAAVVKERDELKNASKEQLENLTAQLAVVVKEREFLKNAAKEQAAKLDASGVQLAAVTAKIGSMTVENNELKNASDELKNASKEQLENLTAQLAAVLKERDELKQALKASDELKTASNELGVQLALATAKIGSMTVENNALKKERDELKQAAVLTAEREGLAKQRVAEIESEKADALKKMSMDMSKLRIAEAKLAEDVKAKEEKLRKEEESSVELNEKLRKVNVELEEQMKVREKMESDLKDCEESLNAYSDPGHVEPEESDVGEGDLVLMVGSPVRASRRKVKSPAKVSENAFQTRESKVQKAIGLKRDRDEDTSDTFSEDRLSPRRRLEVVSRTETCEDTLKRFGVVREGEGPEDASRRYKGMMAESSMPEGEKEILKRCFRVYTLDHF